MDSTVLLASQLWVVHQTGSCTNSFEDQPRVSLSVAHSNYGASSHFFSGFARHLFSPIAVCRLY